MSRIDPRNPYRAGSPESRLTRFLCGLLSILFVLGPIVSLLVYPRQRAELASGTLGLVSGAIVVYLGCLWLGGLFAVVAVSGKVRDRIARYFRS